MSNLPKVKKGIGSGLTRSERIRRTILGIAVAAGMGAATLSPLPATANANVPFVTASSKHQGAIVLIQQSPRSDQGQVAQHYSHMSHYSHSSHYSHVSHYSSSY
jgi:hypothetical protein